MEIIKPQLLKKGDTVGLISPSKAPSDKVTSTEKTKKGVAFLESFGLKVKFANNTYNRDFRNGAPIENRVQDIHDMFLDPEIQMVMMIVGGGFANLVIDKLDYELIRNNPKIFCGMSDGTLLTNSIYLKAGLQTYYGINLNDATGFGSSEKIKDNFYQTFFKTDDIVMTENKDLRFTHWGKSEALNIDYSGWNIIKPGKAEGILTGGYLKRLVTTDYAGFNVDYKNKILFTESGDNIKDLAITISSMEQKGVFKDIKGMIIGYCYNHKDQKDVADLIIDLLPSYNFPIIQIGELGHNVENYVFPIGANCILDTSINQIIIENK